MSEQQSRTLKDQFMLRLPDGMRDRIKAVADANNRSMNAEIVATLEDKYPEFDPLGELSRYLERANEILNSIPEGPERIAARETLIESMNAASNRLGALEIEILKPLMQGPSKK